MSSTYYALKAFYHRHPYVSFHRARRRCLVVSERRRHNEVSYMWIPAHSTDTTTFIVGNRRTDEGDADIPSSCQSLDSSKVMLVATTRFQSLHRGRMWELSEARSSRTSIVRVIDFGFSNYEVVVELSSQLELVQDMK